MPDLEVETMTRSLLWLGGAPCAGKSSVARMLAERYALDVVHVDDSIDACVSQLDAARYPALTRWMAQSWTERWARPPDVLVGEVVACYREHLGFVREQLRTLAGEGRTVLVEGSAILPADIAPTLGSAADAAWLLPSPEFQAHHYALRPWVDGVLQQCADPQGAFERWMGRDAGFAQWLMDEVGRLGLAFITVDGSRDIDELTDLVAQHYGLVPRDAPAR